MPYAHCNPPFRMPLYAAGLAIGLLACGCDAGGEAPPSPTTSPATMTGSVATSEAVRTPPPPSANPRNANALPGADGKTQVTLGDISIETDACTLAEVSPGVFHCPDETHIHFTHRGKRHSLLFTSLYLDANATLYRGPLDASYEQKGHSFVVTDVDGDGHEDLIVWSGRDGAYGGASYEVLLFDPGAQQFEVAPSLSELTVGANGLFSIDGDQLKLTSSDGCCMRVFDTYAIEQREPVLVARVTEERDASTNRITTKTERAIEGKLQEVK